MSHSFDVSRGASERIAPAADDDYFVDVAGLARLMRIAPATVYSDLSRSPWKLPPPCRPRGRRLLLWDRQAAIDWIKRFEESRSEPLALVASYDKSSRRSGRGRPAKTARARAKPPEKVLGQGAGAP